MRKIVAALTVGLLAPFAGPVTTSTDPGPNRAAAAAPRKASLSTFADKWVGHTRFLVISRKGLVREVIDDGPLLCTQSVCLLCSRWVRLVRIGSAW